MSLPYLHMDASGDVITLEKGTSTVGRAGGVDIEIEHPSVSRLHAELVRRGPYLYVSDLGLSRNGTRVNGRPIGRRLLAEGDVISFGVARARVGGLTGSLSGGPRSAADDGVAEAAAPGSGGHDSALPVPTLEMRMLAVPDLTRREVEVLTALCRPLRQEDAFVAPASAREIAVDLVVTEAAVKQHLLRLYASSRSPRAASVVPASPTGWCQPASSGLSPALCYRRRTDPPRSHCPRTLT